jgi:hypothetical protein
VRGKGAAEEGWEEEGDAERGIERLEGATERSSKSKKGEGVK